MRRILKSAIPALLLSVAMMTGCIRDPEAETPCIGGNEAMVEFNIEMPALEIPVTKAGIQTANEVAVENIYVLLFDKDNKYVDKKIVTSFTESATAGDGVNNQKSFTVALPLSTSASDTYNIVLLANVSGDLATAVNAITTGDDRTTVLAALTQKYAGNPAGTNIPMASAPKEAVEIETTTTLSFSMLRMTARIDVSVESGLGYTVKSVHMYNYNNMGRVWTSAVTGTKATGVTIPAQDGTLTAGRSYSYTNPATGNLSGGFYALEAVVDGSKSDRPCVVIELAKDGTSVGYYRAEFLSNTSTESSPVYLDLLRNHRYIFNITKIHGTGFEDPDTAYQSDKTPIESTVIEWDESEMKEIFVSGDYWIGLSSRDLELDKKAQTDKSIVIQTNLTEGWKVEKVTKLDGSAFTEAEKWITSCTKDGDNLAVTVTLNDTGAERYAYAVITAGTVSVKVKITQTAKLPASLKVVNAQNDEITSLVFTSSGMTPTQPAAQSFKLIWEPKSEAVSVATSSLGTAGFVFDASSQLNYTTPTAISSTNSYSVRPVNFTVEEIKANPFAERKALAEFAVTNEDGEKVTQSLILHHINYMLMVNDSQTPAAKEVLTNKEYSLTIKCNTEWTVSTTIVSGLSSGDISIIAPASLSGTANTTGYTFKYKIASGKYGTVRFTFTPKDGTPVSITITSKAKLFPVFALSNIIWDGTKLTFAEDADALTSKSIDPAAQGLLFKWGSLIGISGDGASATAFNAASHVKFKPAGFSGTISGTSSAGWSTVPYCDDNVNNVLLDAFNDEIQGQYRTTGGFDAATGKGDICRYISAQGWVKGNWRMPTSQDFIDFYESSGALGQDLSDYYGWRFGGTSWNYQQQNLTDGKGIITTGWYFGPDVKTAQPTTATSTTVQFPASGYRNASGTLNNVGTSGRYWSCSPYTDTFGNNLYFISTGVYPTNGSDRTYGRTVRCVVAD